MREPPSLDPGPCDHAASPRYERTQQLERTLPHSSSQRGCWRAFGMVGGDGATAATSPVTAARGDESRRPAASPSSPARRNAETEWSPLRKRWSSWTWGARDGRHVVLVVKTRGGAAREREGGARDETAVPCRSSRWEEKGGGSSVILSASLGAVAQRDVGRERRPFLHRG